MKMESTYRCYCGKNIKVERKQPRSLLDDNELVVALEYHFCGEIDIPIHPGDTIYYAVFNLSELPAQNDFI